MGCDGLPARLTFLHDKQLKPVLRERIMDSRKQKKKRRAAVERRVAGDMVCMQETGEWARAGPAH